MSTSNPSTGERYLPRCSSPTLPLVGRTSSVFYRARGSVFFTFTFTLKEAQRLSLRATFRALGVPHMAVRRALAAA